MKIATLYLIAVVLMASGGTVSVDPFVGTWKLNVRKSKYESGQCPKSMTIEMKAAGNGVSYRSETEYPGGRKSLARYTADYNGPEVIVMGANGLLTPVALKRIDSNTVVASYMRAMQAIATSRRVVSKNGKVMTVTTISPDRGGKSVTNIGVYDKVDTP